MSLDSAEFRKRLAAAGRKTELVARAVKATPGLRVVDATAGLGRDGMVLAHLGCEVTLIERSRVIFLLLQDALQRAAADPALAGAVGRITLLHSDSLQLLMAGSDAEVVYLDPMFPEKSGTAAVKGEMQYLQRFLGHDQDAGLLLRHALAGGCSRVVLKRPAKGHWQSPQEPVHVYTAKGSRFEVYLPSV